MFDYCQTALYQILCRLTAANFVPSNLLWSERFDIFDKHKCSQLSSVLLRIDFCFLCLEFDVQIFYENIHLSIFEILLLPFL